jgi:hypothetical protein
MDKMMKLLGVAAAAYMIQRLFANTQPPVKSGTAGLGQEFPSAVLPNMVIGMGPQLVPSGTFHVGADYPLTGEAEMRINPDTGTPYWYRTNPIANVIPGYYEDIRSELMPQFPDWVVRRERERREQLLLDTNASGAMRTALSFTPEQGVALPDGWTVTNMFGMGALPARGVKLPKQRPCACAPSAACCRSVRGHDVIDHLSMMNRKWSGRSVRTCACAPSAGCCTKPTKSGPDWRPYPIMSPGFPDGGGLLGHLAMVSGMGVDPSDINLVRGDVPVESVLGPSGGGGSFQPPSAQELANAAAGAFGGGVDVNFEKGTVGGKQIVPPLGAPAGGGAKKPTTKSKTVQYMMDQRSVETGQEYASRVLTQQQSDREKLKSIGITAKDASIQYVGGPCSTQKAQARLPRGGVSMSSVQRVFEFDDCYLISGSGGMRQIPKYGGEAGGTGAGAGGQGPDYYGMYDAWLRSQPYGAQTKTKSALWQGEDPTAPMVGPDWGGGDNTQLSLNITGGQAQTIVNYPMFPMATPNPATMFTAGPGQALPEGALDTLF